MTIHQEVEHLTSNEFEDQFSFLGKYYTIERNISGVDFETRFLEDDSLDIFSFIYKYYENFYIQENIKDSLSNDIECFRDSFILEELAGKLELTYKKMIKRIYLDKFKFKIINYSSQMKYSRSKLLEMLNKYKELVKCYYAFDYSKIQIRSVSDKYSNNKSISLPKRLDESKKYYFLQYFSLGTSECNILEVNPVLVYIKESKNMSKDNTVTHDLYYNFVLEDGSLFRENSHKLSYNYATGKIDFLFPEIIFDNKEEAIKKLKELKNISDSKFDEVLLRMESK